MKPAIVVVGSLNMDFVVSVEHLPAPGETVLGRNFQMFPGGKGANQACAAAKLGGNSVTVRMIGRVGYDVFADHLKASLSRRRRGCQRRARHQIAGHRRGADLGGPRRAELHRGGLGREWRAGGGRRRSDAAGLSRRAAGAVPTGNAARYGRRRAGPGARRRPRDHSRSGAGAAAAGRTCCNRSIS